MTPHTKSYPISIAIVLLSCCVLWAQDRNNPPTAGPAAPPAASVPLAVLDFETTDIANVTGAQVAGALTAMLAGEPSIRLVERNQIDQVIKELELNTTGLVETNDAIKIGKLVGAKLLVTGRIFLMGESTMITAKIIGTETSLVDGLLVRGKLNTPVDDLVVQLAQRLVERLPQVKERLIAPGDASADPLLALKQSLANREKPRVCVWVDEQHVGMREVAPDPAVQTEIEHLLQSCGFTVVQLPPQVVASWTREGRRVVQADWPAQINDVDILIIGEAFSEVGSRIGQLISCAARAEVKLLVRNSATVPFSDRATTKQVDSGAHLAGRKALQQAGRELGLAILTHFDKTLPVRPQAAPPAP